MFNRLIDAAKNFDHKKAFEDSRERLGDGWEKVKTKSDESFDSIKGRIDRSEVKDQEQFEEGFKGGHNAVVNDMETGNAKSPSHYIGFAERSFRGDYRKGYVAGVDNAFGDL